jgi:signal transduction histidine kinase
MSLYYLFGAAPLIILTSIFFMFIFYLILSSKIVHSFHQVSDSIEQLAEGNFKSDFHIQNTGPFSHLNKSLNGMKDHLNRLIEEEKHASQTKNELVTNVSHDLRTPLTSIIGYLRLIQEDRYKDETELRYFVDIAYQKSERLNRMVNDLFEFTKVNNNDITLFKVNFNVIEFMNQIGAQFIPQLRDASIKLEVFHSDESIIIQADPEKLMRVFENLILNAIKYGKEGKKIDLVVEKDEKNVVIKVVNYGPPIPSNAIPHIFDRLYRAEQSRSDETGGAGLGLAIAKGIVEIHGGIISASSNHHKTIFQVKLPLMKETG